MLPADPDSSGLWEKNKLRSAANLETLRPFMLFDDDDDAWLVSDSVG